MKKFILTILFCLFTINADAAVTEMGWTATIEANTQAAKNANDARYLEWIGDINAQDSAQFQDEYGLSFAIAYNITGTTSYCDTAFSYNGGCTSAADRNKTRDCTVDRALAYSMCGDVVSGANKTTWEAQLDAVVAKVTGVAPYTNHGTRTGDTDELMGQYFGCLIYDLAKNGVIDQCVNAVDNYAGNTKPFGGVDVTGDDKTTLRNAVAYYWNHFSDGTFVEGSEYNMSTIRYVLQGVNAINNFYGTDKFPEITSLFSKMASFHYQSTTPDYSQRFQFGDVQSNSGLRTLFPYRTMALFAMMAHLDSNDANMWDLWRTNVYATSGLGRMDWMMYYDHDATATKASGQTSFNAEDAGTALFHEDWTTNGTFISSRYEPRFFADHMWDGFSNFNVWKDDGWVIKNPLSYYGQAYNETPWLNTLLVGGSFGCMKEACGQTGYEAGTGYMWHAGVSSGFWQNSGTSGNSDSPPWWIWENSDQKLFRINPDGTETIFNYQRIDSCKPSDTACMTTAKYNRLISSSFAGTGCGTGCTAGNAARAIANSWKHAYSINADSLPVQSGDTFHWTADNVANTYVELHTFMDSYTPTIINMAPTTSGGQGTISGSNLLIDGSNSPYYFGTAGIIPSEVGEYQLRLNITPAGARTLYPILNVFQLGAAAESYTEITNTLGSEDVQGAMVENSVDRVIFLASAEPDLTTTFTSTLGSNSVTYDPARLTKADGMRKFKLGGQATYTTDDTKDIDIFIVGLDTGYTWTIQKDGGASAGCTVSSEGICHFTQAGSVGSHTVTWTVSGSQDCDDICALCSTEPLCTGSVQTCYWHNNDGATAFQCNVNPAPSDNCPTDYTQCDNQIDCEFNEFCWNGTNCVESCVPPPETTEVTIYATEDTYIDQDAATTNYDTAGLKIQSSTASSGVESVDTSTFTIGGGSPDVTYLSKTATRISASSSQRDNSENWSYKDYGASYFGAFDIDFTYNVGFTGSTGFIGALCLSNSAASTMSIMNANNDGLCVQFERFGQDGLQIRNYNNGTSVSTEAQTSSTGQTYYANFNRVGTTCTLNVYSDAAKTTHVTASPSTLTCGDASTTKYRYLYGLVSCDNPDCNNTTRSDGYIENISINQADSGGSPSSTDNKALLQFSLAAIPADALIVSAELEGTWSSAGPGISGTLYAFEGSRDFTENQSTWNVYTTGNSWATAGARGIGDMVGTWSTGAGSLASYAFSGVQSTGDNATFTSNSGMIELVTDNIGGNMFLYVDQEPLATAALVNLYDSENATTANRPRLIINYLSDDGEVDPPPAQPPIRTQGGGVSGGGVIGG